MTPDVNEVLRKLRQKKPFILTITDYFPMGYVASGIRSIGGFPIMCNAEEEVEEFIEMSQSIVINLGKIDNAFIQLCQHICKIANAKNIPITLDPAGAGTSRYRTDAAINLIQKHQISIVRGYPNEILSLLTGDLVIQEHQLLVDEKLILENARSFAKKYNMAVVVSGKRHIVVDSNHMDQFNFNSALLQKVAGIGNLLSAIISAFNAVEKNKYFAARNAVHFYAECVGPTSCGAAGPASLIIGIIDKLYTNAVKAQLFT